MATRLSKALRLSCAMTIGVGMCAAADTALAQSVRVEETAVAFPTYPYGDPDPIPKPGKIYPYFRFDGYARAAAPATWHMITLENDYLTVEIAPDIGGKIWGAVDKRDGRDFLYRNAVVKFRDIALRGAWTAGGVEFNFGTFGHTPAAAAPVDYAIEKLPDGSVAVTVGDYDWASHTRWNVRIRLAKDAKAIETRTTSFNLGTMPTTLYNWSNAAAHVSADLKFDYPGSRVIGHDGLAASWPRDDQGRDLSLYRNNIFGSNKSYHVLSDGNDFFGGLRSDSDSGFGHVASYAEKPGRKLWLWANSREGGIWSTLLADQSGQYLEFQSGRLFNQPAPPSSLSPFKQSPFAAHDDFHATEWWFPMRDVGDPIASSPKAVAGVSGEAGAARLIVYALQPIQGTMQLAYADGRRETQSFSLSAGAKQAFPLSGKLVRLASPTAALYFDQAAGAAWQRPAATPAGLATDRGAACGRLGADMLIRRDYADAAQQFAICLEKDPFDPAALLGSAQLAIHRDDAPQALALTRRVLALDSYDGAGNYLAGAALVAQRDDVGAREAFSIATIDPAHRAAADIELAKIRMRAGDFAQAVYFANEALQFNAGSLDAREILAVASRATGDADGQALALAAIRALDPTYPLLRTEAWLQAGARPGALALGQLTRSEFPDRVVMEIARRYLELGRWDDAQAVLSLAPDHALVALWRFGVADLAGNRQAAALALHDALAASPRQQFAEGRETLAFLQKAESFGKNWQISYYQAQILAQMGRDAEALAALSSVGAIPDFAPFYAFRAQFAQRGADQQGADLRRAAALDSGQWRYPLRLAQLELDQGHFASAETDAARAYALDPGQSSVILVLVRAQLAQGKAVEAAALLDRVALLPSEFSADSRDLFAIANSMQGLALAGAGRFAEAEGRADKARGWPEALGVGKPYDVDETIPDALRAVIAERRCQREVAQTYWRKVADAPYHDPRFANGAILTGLAQVRLGQARDLDQWAATARLSGDIGDWVRAVGRGTTVQPAPPAQVADLQRALLAGIAQAALTPNPSCK